MRIITSILIIFLFISEVAQAQSFYGSRRNRNMMITAGTGTSSYFGDINSPGDRFDSKLNLNIGLQYYIAPRFGARAEVTWFQLRGTDEEVYPERNLSFESNNVEANIMGIFNILEHGSRFYQRPTVSPYLFVGVGLLWFHPTANYGGQTYSLRQFQTEGVDYSPVTLVFPYGGGVRFKAGPFFNIGLEIGYRHALSDYLDDASTVYVDKTDPNNIVSNLPDIEIALSDRRPEAGRERWEAGHIRGNPEDNDGYAIFNLKIEYYLPGSLFSGSNSRKPPRNRYNRRRR